MKASELRKLIREEAKKIVKEAAAITLPSGMQIINIAGKLYNLEYVFSSEPTIREVEAMTAVLRKQFSKIADTIQAGPIKGEATIYVRGGDVTVGIEFDSKLGLNQMQAITDVQSRDDY